MVAIILQDSFLPAPASDLLFLGADLREIRSQSPEALAAKTQSICVLSRTSADKSKKVCASFLFPGTSQIFEFQEMCGLPLTWQCMLTTIQHFKIPVLYLCFIFIDISCIDWGYCTPATSNQSILWGGAAVCACPVNRWHLAQPENKSPELEYFLSHFQILITQLNIVHFLQSQVVLNFSCSALQYSDITF